MQRSFRWTSSARSVSSVRKRVGIHRFVVAGLDAAGLGQEFSGFDDVRLLKPSAESGSCDDERRLGVTFLECMIFEVQVRIRKEHQDPSSQTGQQQLH